MVQVDHMLGIPGDTIEFQEESALLYNRVRPDLISIFWLNYYPRTEIIDTALEMELIQETDVEKINNGISITGKSYLCGGSLKNPGPFYSISFLFNYIPIIPAWLVQLLIRTRIYRLFAVKNYIISTALPRAIRSTFNRRDFRGRSYILRFLRRTLFHHTRLGRCLRVQKT
jgi:hypothetical protein